MRFLRRASSHVTDATTCALLNLAQWRHRSHAVTLLQLQAYVAACSAIDRPAFYAAPALRPVEESSRHLRWASPYPLGFTSNDQASALLFEGARGWSAPTVLILHALMSVNDIGYRRLAARFNDLGWNAAFLHLPFHYARRPRGYLNGELAITADLVRNGGALRQGVTELRQLMAFLRTRGCGEFGLFATSYGAWTGAVLASLEQDLSFLALLVPITDTQHAIWQSPAGQTIRGLLQGNGIDESMTGQHAHLSSPLHGLPSVDRSRIVLAAGAYDRIAPPDRVEALATAWGGARIITSPQGHFGYVAERDMFAAVREMIA
jgi:hypothetical protein